MQSFPNPMVSDPILSKVVGPDFFWSAFGANLLQQEVKKQSKSKVMKGPTFQQEPSAK